RIPEINSVLFDAVNLNSLPPIMLHGHDERLRGIVFSRDNRMMASISLSGTVLVWETATGRQLLALNGSEYGIRTAAFDGSSDLLATGSWDGTLLLWDIATGNQVAELGKHARSVENMAFSPDGT